MKIAASVNYHVRKHQPQAFVFDADGIAGNLISPELVTTPVEVTDLRGQQDRVNFIADGICFKHEPSAIKRFDEGSNWQAQYNQEVTELLTQTIGAKEVLVFDHTVRIDDADAVRKPARNVHNDYSEEGANQRLIDLLGEEKALEYQNGHFGFVNLWRPVEHPITSSPLGFIRPSSTAADDWMNIALIYPDRVGSILGVAANPKHEWFYLSQMTPDDLVIFNIFDNQNRPYLAHSALDLDSDKHINEQQEGRQEEQRGEQGALSGIAPPNSQSNRQPNKPPRKSIETRTLVLYN